MTDRWWLVFAVVLIVAGATVLLILRRPGGKHPAEDHAAACDGSCAKGIRTGCAYCGVEHGVGLDHLDWCPRGGIDVPLDGPDGSHDDMSDVDAERWAAEIEWLYAAMPEAVALDQGDDLLAPPPVIPGRDTTP